MEYLADSFNKTEKLSIWNETSIETYKGRSFYAQIHATEYITLPISDYNNHLEAKFKEGFKEGFDARARYNV